MQQFLHLLIVDRTARASLCQLFDRRWLLPVIACGERDRAPLVAARWLSNHRLPGVVAGQWLGRIATGGRSIDWLMVIAADDLPPQLPFCRVPVDSLEPPTAAIGYQAWAVGAAVQQDAVGVIRPFGTIDWIDHARSWIESTGFTGLSTATCFRASANDVVLGLRSRAAAVYFKAAAADRAADVAAMARIARRFPESFPRLLALEEAGDATRSLLEGCPGVPLARLRDDRETLRVARDISRLQRSAAPEPSSTLNIADILQHANALLAHARLPQLSHAALSAFDDVMSLPEGWTPLDLDPSNVFVDGRQIRYIDLEPRLTVMPMALSIFARRLGATGERLQELRRSYESTAGAGIPWRSVDLVSELVEIVTGWQRVIRHVEYGEVSGPLDRIERAVANRVASAGPLV